MPLVAVWLISDIAVHERTHNWIWSEKEEFIRFVGRNKSPAIQSYLSNLTLEQKEKVPIVIAEMLERDFPGAEAIRLPMSAYIVAGLKR